MLGLQCHWPCWQVRPSAATRSRLALAAKLIEVETMDAAEMGRIIEEVEARAAVAAEPEAAAGA